MKKDKTDLQDTPDDRKHLQPDNVVLDLPEVKDIPGQEHTRIPPPGTLGDITIASDDEEGKGILDDDNDDNRQSDANVTPVEKKLLATMAEDMPATDDVQLRAAALDTTDNDGDPLNEKSSGNDLSGEDLDVPGSDDDDAEEEIGEEDEENNSYSLGADKDD